MLYIETKIYKAMETVQIVTSPSGKAMKMINGTYFHKETPDDLCRIIERLRTDMPKKRVVFDYGDPETGRSWGERYDICGYIGRSMGPEKAPLLYHNKRSTGGGIISSDKILSIRESMGKKLIWQHPVLKNNQATIPCSNE